MCQKLKGNPTEADSEGVSESCELHSKFAEPSTSNMNLLHLVLLISGAAVV
jgi:hypothetical protein